MYKLLVVNRDPDPDVLNAARNVWLGVYTLNASGRLVSTYPTVNLYSERYIPVKPSTPYTIYGASIVAQYSAPYEGAIVLTNTGLDPAGINVFATWAQTAYIRVTGPVQAQINEDTFWMVEGANAKRYKGWLELDLGADKPVMSYVANDVAELQDRQLTYSRSLALPKTTTNTRFFEDADLIQSRTDKPYRKHECRLLLNGVSLTGTGAVLKLLSSGKYYNVQILAGERDFFDLLENTSMFYMDLDSFLRVDSAMLPANWDVAAGQVFAKATFSKNGEAITDGTIASVMPFYYEHKVMTKLLSSLGFSWLHNLNEVEPDWNKYALAMTTLKVSTNSLLPLGLNGMAQRDIAHSGYTSSPYYIVPDILNNATGRLAKLGIDGNPVPAGLLYTSPFDGTAKVKVSVVWQTASIHPLNPLRMWVQVLGGDGVEQLFTTLQGTPLSFEAEVTLVQDATAEVYVYFTGDTDNYGADVGNEALTTIRFEDFVSEYVPLGGQVWASGNLGYDTMADYFKAFVQKYGLVVYVDHSIKTVYTYTMQKVYDNIPRAKDWSSKLHVSEDGPELTYTIDKYAITNRILLKPNSDDHVEDYGSFSVDNDTLELSTDLFTIDLKSSKEYPMAERLVLNVPVFSYDADADLYEYDGSGAQQAKIELIDGVYYARAVPAQTLIDKFYGPLVNKILNQAKMIECEFLLYSQDLTGFDPTIPVYVAQLGGYFYINKIQDFAGDGLTTVQLIKL